MKRKPPLLKEAKRWAILCGSDNRLDGKREWLQGDGSGLPRMFMTRKSCRAYIEKHFSYIRTRPDLKAEPHGWKMPQAVKVMVAVEYHWRLS